MRYAGVRRDDTGLLYVLYCTVQATQVGHVQQPKHLSSEDMFLQREGAKSMTISFQVHEILETAVVRTEVVSVVYYTLYI